MTRGLRVLVVAAALAVTGLLVQRGAAPVARAGSPVVAKACKTGRVPLKLSGRKVSPRGRGKSVCVRVPPAVKGDAARLAAEVTLLFNPALADGIVARALRSGAARRTLRALKRRLLSALAPAQARPARATEVTVTTEDGITTRQTVTSPDPDEVGAGISRQLSGKLTGGGEDSAFVKRCPDAQGVVTGERRYKVTTSFSVETMGKRVAVTEEIGWEAKLEGHVQDNAHLKDFKYEATGHIETRADLYDSTGKFLAHTPTRVLRWTIARAGIDPHNSAANPNDFLNSVQWNARGPKGTSFDAGDGNALATGLVLTDSDLADRGANILLQAELEWYDQAKCLKAEFNPDPLSGNAGQSFDVETKVRHQLEHTEVAIPLKAEVGYAQAGCPGSVSPQEADARPGAPAHFTYVAASDCGGRDTWPDAMRVEGFSKRGRVLDLLNGTFKRSSLPKAYVGTVNGSTDHGESWAATGVTFNQTARPEQYELAGGTATWQLNFEQSGCTTTAGPVTFSLSPSSNDGYDYGTTKPAGAILWDVQSNPAYSAFGTWGKRVTAHMSCPPDFTMDYPYDVAPHWFSTYDPQTNSTPPNHPADPNANLQGTATGSWSGYNLTWTWDLAPVR